MFACLISRCVIPAACAAASPSATPTSSSTICRQVRFSAFAHSFSVPPSTNSVTRYCRPSSSPASWTVRIGNKISFRMPQRLTLALPAFLLVASAATIAQRAAGPTLPAETLLDRSVLTALDEELSGVAAKDHVSRLTQFHRVPASAGFHEAIAYVQGRATAFGLSDVHVETFPGDGTTYFGTLHGNRGWRVDGGSLDEVTPRARRIISVDDVRLAVADNSERADVTAQLVDVGGGARER